jgi:YkoP-like protein
MALLGRNRERNWLNRFPWSLLRLGRSGGGRAFGVISVWVWWERFTNWRARVRPVNPESFLSYAPSHYGGKERTLGDGTVLHKGDRIIELHFNNAFITRMIVDGRFTPWRALRLAARDIEVLQRRVVAGDLGDVRALHAITLFASTGTRIGMEVRPLPHSPYWGLVRYFMVGLIALHHPDGWKHASRSRESMWPGELWLGIETMRRRADSEPPHAPADVPDSSTGTVEQGAD